MEIDKYYISIIDNSYQVQDLTRYYCKKIEDAKRERNYIFNNFKLDLLEVLNTIQKDIDSNYRQEYHHYSLCSNHGSNEYRESILSQLDALHKQYETGIWDISLCNYSDDLSETFRSSRVLNMKNSISTNDINEIRQAIEYAYNQLSSKLDKTTHKQHKGFNTSLKTREIENLYHKLQDNYIDCSLDNWKAIFNDKEPIKKNSIKWLHNKTNSFRLLAYLIQKVFYSVRDKDVRIEWQQFSQIFNTRNLKQELSKNPYPKGAKKIDTIIKGILIK